MIIQLDLAIEGRSWEKEFVDIGTMQYIKQDGQTVLFLVKEDVDAGKLANIVGFREIDNDEILVVFTVFDFHTEEERYYIYDSRKSLRTGRFLLKRVEEGLTNFGKIVDKYIIEE
ncbi:hypothetical protein [Bacillus toyonensis]|uniref:hypothetical protein n=1 Tax=Bacillus toyonensis TaxID=155322 RepID=UPI000BF687B2|nr:hypothetical protein [Bacillus toyonensis]PGF04987.1 hypothetical protein COM61_00680 [Bacillus toyonensis]